ncbi:hypothetical protein E5Q_06641 [Mixia osmundae IAM 14324]|uniref:Phospholipase A-2-activating protein n=1 Tax=Mixia osmundae (strain CBS 9802 / IAM 14324 / JCM 22182 / KY 12970) TaxID=764103 RepID=G7EAS8_MIXOS|nr:hypothetical protein E5Q_06641 [Mixia osmundae IAM 14324]
MIDRRRQAALLLCSCATAVLGQSLTTSGPVPTFVTRYAPLMYLASTEEYFPSHLQTHLDNTTPGEWDDSTNSSSAVSGAPSSLTLANLDQSELSTAFVYLNARPSELTVPTSAWLNSTYGKPNSAGMSAAETIIILVDASEEHVAGTIDAYYFYFYSYNLGPYVFGERFGNHVGDWENSMIRFVNGVPQAVFYSAHDDGDAYTFDTVNQSNSRPIGYIAMGSHANYPTPGSHNISQAIGQLLTDYTDSGTLWDVAANYQAFWFSGSNDSPNFTVADGSTFDPGFLYYIGKWGDHALPESNPAQSDLFGYQKWTDGPTGPRDKTLLRQAMCYQNCPTNTVLPTLSSAAVTPVGSSTPTGSSVSQFTFSLMAHRLLTASVRAVQGTVGPTNSSHARVRRFGMADTIQLVLSATAEQASDGAALAGARKKNSSRARRVDQQAMTDSLGASSKAQYKLSATLQGHTADVRSTCAPRSDLIISCSRDSTARTWTRTPGSATAWEPHCLFQGAHEGFVNAVSFVHAKHADGQDVLLTSGQDAIIYGWPIPSSSGSETEAKYALIGHSNNVCCLDVGSDGRIISGSWDSTAKIWINFELHCTLSGHEQAVWAVLAISASENKGTEAVLTASADKMIRLFTGSKPSSASVTFKGHTQPVRALARIPEHPDMFASGSNDGSIRLWNLEGDAIADLGGHDSFVYSLDVLPDSGDLLSGGEDRNVKVWSADDGELLQTITVPAVSVWSVSALPNGDIAAGSSDGILRVFTRDTARLASEEELQNFDASVSSIAINSASVGDVKKQDLPEASEALRAPGRKEGQVIMVKTSSGSVEAHQWRNAAQSWQKVGEVVDAVGSGRKQLYKGEEYDYVFDVDVKEGSPPLKLPFNSTQNPYTVAQKFLTDNELPPDYLDEVVRFIERNSGAVSLGNSAPAANPYNDSASSAPDSEALLPHKTPLTFTSANLAALRTKLIAFNDDLRTASSAYALDDSDLDKLENLTSTLQGTPTVLPANAAASASTIVPKLLQWPVDKRFPAIDLVRITSCHGPAEAWLSRLLENLKIDSSASAKDQETNAMLALRSLANYFATPKGKTIMIKNAVTILNGLYRIGEAQLSRTGYLALATVILNFSVLAVMRDLDKTSGTQLIDLTQKALTRQEGEAVYRGLVALGNVLLSPNVTSSLSSSTLTQARASAQKAASRLPEPRIKAVAAEIAQLTL